MRAAVGSAGAAYFEVASLLLACFVPYLPTESYGCPMTFGGAMLPLLFFVFLSADVWSAKVEYFVKEPRSEPYYVTAGSQDLLLPCAVEATYASSQPNSVYWMRLVDNTPYLVRTDAFYEIDTTSCAGCFNLHIKSVDYARDNGKFYCQMAAPDGSTHTSKEANVVVLVRPGQPELNEQSLVLTEGVGEELKCHSVGGNPPPQITWFHSNGTELTHLSTTVNGTNKEQPTVSTLRFVASASDKEQKLVCKIWNVAMGDSMAPYSVETNPLVVLYRPKVTVRPGPVYSVEVGREAKLSCDANAYPPPTKFSWRRSAGLADSTWVERNISFIVDKDHAGSYTCTSENLQGIGEATVNLDVQYEPDINLLSEVIVKEGESLHLKCDVTSNPPPYTVSWITPDQEVHNSSVLQLSSVNKAQAGTYTCMARNRLTVMDQKSAERVASKSTTVIVSHQPGLATITVDEPVVIGATVTLNCSADSAGYPPARYRWKAPGQADYEYGARYTYTIPDVQLSHAGEYWCLPFNDIGNGQEGSYKLIVREPAHLGTVLRKEETIRGGHSGYSLSCTAHGNPLPNITWYFDNEPISSSHFIVSSTPEAQSCEIPERCSFKVSSTLKWTSAVQWNDKGFYTCSADNGAGRPSESTMFLKVQHKPVIINDPERPVVASDFGEIAQIVCKVTASPEPVFRWYRDGQELVDYGSKFDSNHVRNHSFDVYENALIIRDVEKGDMGAYSCKAANLFGEDVHVFKLLQKSKPDPPKELKVETQSHKSILLSWVPGFDGGHRQKFAVELTHDDHVLKTFQAPAAEAGKWRPNFGIEKALPVEFNVTGLAPSTLYSFRVKASNQLGETAWTQSLTAATEDAPTNPSIRPPVSATYNSMTQELEVNPVLDSGHYCLMVYLQKPSGLWERWDCAPTNGKIDSVPTAAALRVRNCYFQTLECSEPLEVAVNVATAIGWEVIAAICCTVLFFLLLFAMMCFYCRKHRLNMKKKQMVNGNVDLKLNGPDVKRIREISAPIYSDQLLNAAGLGVDRNTASSKDSGVFTFSNYPYDGYTPEMNGHAYSEGATLPRPASYDDTDQWASSGCRISGNLNNSDGVICSDPAQLKPAGALAGLYNHDLVDMNPAGGSLYASREGSVHSGYSTPSQKRVIREIIV
ncbi:hypothetical protein M513_02957 [Trichuris suis]|uniref:Fibronectin type III domain protein n=1 Tax=Trichuris suis TaxID=68888 RepID=A0A085MG33_9BILA|nr:hypothetical protein M513_02957 [Trichuris suis]